MRTPPRLIAALLAAGGVGMLGASTPAAAQTVNLGTCSAWSINNNVFTCTPVNTGGGNTTTAPSGCSVAVSPPSGNAGTSVTVSVACSGGSAPTSYSWSGGFMNGSTSSSGIGTVNANTAFNVTVGNSAGSTQAQAGSFTVSSSTGGGGGNSGGGIACTGPSTTLAIPWPSTRTVNSGFSATAGGFADGVLVVQFKTGSNAGPGYIAGAEYQSAPTTRTAVLSKSPCDFSNAIAIRSGVSITQYYVMGTGRNPYNYPVLEPNTTYYWNIKNEVNGMPTCGSSCNMIINLKSP